MKIIGKAVAPGVTNLPVIQSVHGLGTGVEKLHEKFLAQGGQGGKRWLQKFPFHSFCEGDDFSKWCLSQGVTLAKSKDGAWAVAVETDSIVKNDKAGYPLAVGAKKVLWLADV